MGREAYIARKTGETDISVKLKIGRASCRERV